MKTSCCFVIYLLLQQRRRPIMNTPLRRILSITCALFLITLCTAPAAMAYSYYDDYPQYVVESYSPSGYCYLYDAPSDTQGRNLGRHNNGEIVKVIDWNASGDYALSICANGSVGYIRKNCIVPLGQASQRNLWRVSGATPCNMYDQPSDMDSTILGQYNHGDYMEMIDYNADATYAKVMSITTRACGYIRKDCLVAEDDYRPVQFYVYVYGPNGTCAMYDQPSGSSGNSIGSYANGTRMGVIDWAADGAFARVEGPDGRTGYMNKAHLSY